MPVIMCLAMTAFADDNLPSSTRENGGGGGGGGREAGGKGECGKKGGRTGVGECVCLVTVNADRKMFTNNSCC